MSALTRWIVCVWLALVAAVMLVSLSACGGGGGGGGAVAAVDPAPVAIVTPPADVTVAAGGSATFSVGATGDGLAYQWQSSSDGTRWTDVPGASASSFVLIAVSAADSGRRYRVVVGNVAGIQASAAAVLTVTAPGGGGVAGVPDTCQPPFALPAGTVIDTTASTPAGSFHACKYVESGTDVADATIWVLAGYGIGLKSVTTSATTTTTAMRVNGEPLTHFP